MNSKSLKNKKESGLNKKIAVLYHAECLDGFTAAYAAFKKFGERAEYRPVKYQEEPPEGLKEKEIYIVDFSYPKTVLKKITENNKKVVVIDHHKTARENIKAADEFYFDLEHSGAYLAWKYFWPEKRAPKLVSYVEDQDLWRFKLPQTKFIMAYISTISFDFRQWGKLEIEMEELKKRKEFIRQGKILAAQTERIIEWLADKKAYLVEFEGRKTLAVNNSYKIITSELGHILSKKQPPLAIIWSERGGLRDISLRTDGSIDAGKVAAKYGGGGHPGAASFRWPADKPWPWKIIR